MHYMDAATRQFDQLADLPAGLNSFADQLADLPIGLNSFADQLADLPIGLNSFADQLADLPIALNSFADQLADLPIGLNSFADQLADLPIGLNSFADQLADLPIGLNSFADQLADLPIGLNSFAGLQTGLSSFADQLDQMCRTTAKAILDDAAPSELRNEPYWRAATNEWLDANSVALLLWFLAGVITVVSCVATAKTPELVEKIATALSIPLGVIGIGLAVRDRRGR